MVGWNPIEVGDVPNGVLERIEKDMYYGNGKPGLCTRMEVAEGEIKDVAEKIASLDKKFWALILLALTILGTEIAGLVKSAEHPQSQQVRSFTE